MLARLSLCVWCFVRGKIRWRPKKTNLRIWQWSIRIYNRGRNCMLKCSTSLQPDCIRWDGERRWRRKRRRRASRMGSSFENKWKRIVILLYYYYYYLSGKEMEQEWSEKSIRLCARACGCGEIVREKAPEISAHCKRDVLKSQKMYKHTTTFTSPTPRSLFHRWWFIV